MGRLHHANLINNQSTYYDTTKFDNYPAILSHAPWIRGNNHFLANVVSLWQWLRVMESSDKNISPSYVALFEMIEVQKHWHAG